MGHAAGRSAERARLAEALRGTGGPGWLEDDAYADWIERAASEGTPDNEGSNRG